MTRSLQLTPIRTETFRAHQNINEFITNSLTETPLVDASILVVTSKIVSLSEGRIAPKDGIDKDVLVTSEADYDLGEVAYGCRLTIKDGLFIPSAGIDESNSENGGFILFPKDAFDSARRLHKYLSEFYKIKSLGVLITDSHTLPLRQGVTGIALSYWGFEGVRNLIGKKDLFGRPLTMTKMDIADGLASAAVLMMGEADEACPLAIIKHAPVSFCTETNPEEIRIPPEQDLYFPLYRDRLKQSQSSGGRRISNEFKRLRANVLKDNPDMTSFEKGALDFLLSVQEFEKQDPERMKRLVDYVKGLKAKGLLPIKK